MGLFDFIKGNTRKTIKPHYKVGQILKVVSFSIKTPNGIRYLNIEEMADYFKKRQTRYMDVIISAFYIEIIREEEYGEGGMQYLAKLEGDEVLLMRYCNRFSYLDDIKKTWYWYPTGLDGYYIDYQYAVKCLSLVGGIPKKLIARVKTR